MKSRLADTGFRRLLFLIPVFFAVAIFFQISGGAFQSEFGGHPDEAAHYVTGLMIHDYVAAKFPGSPMTYAKDYYEHYPKVALGNWPPVFYVMQTAWALIFSPDRISILLLMAFLAALVAASLFHLLQREVGVAEAVAGALLFLCAPLTQRHTAMIMTEIPIALFSLLAILFFARFLENEKAIDSIWFGFFASLAILTKGSGLFLGMVPPLALLFTGKWRLLKRPAFWSAAAIVFVLCFPWTWKFRDVARAGWMEGNPSLNFTKQAFIFYPSKLLLSLGIGLTLLALVGIVAKCFLPKKEERAEKWPVFTAALLSLLIFHSIIPAGLEDRHLVPVLPLALAFAMAGAKWASHFLKEKGLTISRVTLLVLAGLVFSIQAFKIPWRNEIPHKGYQGFAPAAEALLQNTDLPKDATFLISSDARGEGMFISEVAMREKRPGHTVRRASKLLASSTWSGSGYEAKFKDEAALRNYLLQSPMDLIVADFSLPDWARKEHHDLLRRTLDKFPEQFLLEAEFPIQRGNVWTNGVYVYRVNRN